MMAHLRTNAFAWVLLIGGLSASSCRTTPSNSADSQPQITAEEFVLNAHRYGGRAVKVCGRLSAPPRDNLRWGLSEANAAEGDRYHGPMTALVLPCPSTTPRLDRNGCLTGVVARRDGSFEQPPLTPTTVVVPPINNEWFLHAQCPAR